MSTYKMDWKENDIVKSDDMNRIEENVYNAQEMLDTKLDTSGDGSNLSSIFTQASVRENINSGDSLKTIMAKMKKWFSDLKPLAFKEKISMEDLEQTVKTMVNNALQSSAVANNLTTTNEKMVLGAPMGKELSEQISELNQNLTIKYFKHASELGVVTQETTINNLVNMMPDNSILEAPFFATDVPSFNFPQGIGLYTMLRIMKGLDEYVSVSVKDLVNNIEWIKSKYAATWTDWKANTIQRVYLMKNVELNVNQLNIIEFDFSSFNFREVLSIVPALINTDTNMYAQITFTNNSSVDSSKKCIIKAYSDRTIIVRISVTMIVE